MIFPLFSLHFSLDNFHWHIYQATFEMAEEILYCWYQDFTSIILTWSFLINFSFCLSTHLLYVLSTFSSKSLNIIMVSLSPRQVFLNYGMYWIIYLIISQSLFYLTLFIILMRLNFLQVTASVCSIQSTVFTCFLCGSAGKNPPAMQETWVPSLGWEDALEKGKSTHSSILAWRIPRTV